MMTRQTRDERGQKDLYKSNLNLYKKLRSCQPSSVSKAEFLNQKEAKRAYFVNLLSNRVTNVERVKNIA